MSVNTDLSEFKQMRRAKREIRVLRAAKNARTRRPRPLIEWVPYLSPEFKAPAHLGPVVSKLEEARLGRDRFRLQMCFSVPPGHWKSQTLHHWLALCLAENPALRIGYGTYDRTFADENVASIRALVERARIPVGKVDRAGVFTTKARGRVMGFGLQKPPTGRRFDIIIVDDPYSSRAEAESATIRGKVFRGFTADLMTRQAAGGSIVIVLHTRWHPDDLIGELERRGWTTINLPAEDENGTPLLPEFWTRTMLDQQRAASEYDWWSLFMGKPRPPGGTIFLDAPALVDDFGAATGHSYVIGLDIARGENQKNDANAYAVTRKLSTDRSLMPSMDLLDWYEEPGPIATIDQVDEGGKRTRRPGFIRHLIRLQQLHPGAVFCMYVGRTETNMLDLISSASLSDAEYDVPNSGLKGADMRRRIVVHPLETQGSKLWNRAEAGYAPAWNAGRVRVPRRDPRTGKLVTTHKNFVGGHAIDHLISAATSAYDWHRGLGRNTGSSGRSRTTGEGSEATRGGVDLV